MLSTIQYVTISCMQERNTAVVCIVRFIRPTSADMYSLVPLKNPVRDKNIITILSQILLIYNLDLTIKYDTCNRLGLAY